MQRARGVGVSIRWLQAYTGFCVPKMVLINNTYACYRCCRRTGETAHAGMVVISICVPNTDPIGNNERSPCVTACAHARWPACYIGHDQSISGVNLQAECADQRGGQ